MRKSVCFSDSLTNGRRGEKARAKGRILDDFRTQAGFRQKLVIFFLFFGVGAWELGAPWQVGSALKF